MLSPTSWMACTVTMLKMPDETRFVAMALRVGIAATANVPKPTEASGVDGPQSWSWRESAGSRSAMTTSVARERRCVRFSAAGASRLAADVTNPAKGGSQGDPGMRSPAQAAEPIKRPRSHPYGLVRAPRGLPSTRAIASQTGLSPTTVSKALRNLSDIALAEQRAQTRLGKGRAVERTLWYANLDHSDIASLLPYLHTVLLPTPPQDLPSGLPKAVWHLFWNADPQDIDPIADASLVAHRAMSASDPESLGWAVSALPTKGWVEALQFRNVQPDNVAWLRTSRTARTSHAAPDVVRGVKEQTIDCFEELDLGVAAT